MTHYDTASARVEAQRRICSDTIQVTAWAVEQVWKVVTILAMAERKPWRIPRHFPARHIDAAEGALAAIPVERLESAEARELIKELQGKMARTRVLCGSILTRIRNGEEVAREVRRLVRLNDEQVRLFRDLEVCLLPPERPLTRRFAAAWGTLLRIPGGS